MVFARSQGGRMWKLLFNDVEFQFYKMEKNLETGLYHTVH